MNQTQTRENGALSGRSAFLALAAELRAGVEPAAHWWRNLGAEAQRAYLAAGDGMAWGELSEADRAALRLRHRKNAENLAALSSQFAYRRGLAK